MRIFAITLFMFLMLVGTASAQVPAFPGCEGPGCVATGGRGGTIYRVTNLNNSGSGSLRACMEASGTRTCVIQTCGTLRPSSQISVGSGNLTVLGQTACGGGLLIRGDGTPASGGSGNMINISQDNVILRYLKIRKGHNGCTSAQGGKPLRFEEPADTIVVDHMSLTWTCDENFNMTQRDFNGNLSDSGHSITVSNSILAEPDNAHPVNMLIGLGSSLNAQNAFDQARDISVNRNYFGPSSHRNPLIAAKGPTWIVNNLMYNPKRAFVQLDWYGAYGAIQTPSNPAIADIIGNHFVQGNLASWSPIREVKIKDNPNAKFATVYVSGNEGPNMDANDSLTEQWNAGVWGNDEGDSFNNRADYVIGSVNRRSSPWPQPTHPFSIIPAADVVDAVMPYVGASMRIDCDGTKIKNRDSVDDSIVQDYYDGTGTIPSSYTWPNISTSPGACADSDGDGMPNEFEAYLTGGSTTSAAPWGDHDGDGYGNIEEYANGRCPLLKSGRGPLTGWGAPYDVDTGALTIDIEECDTASDVPMEITADWIYYTAYVYRDATNSWQPFSLSGSMPNGQWFEGSASANVPQTEAELHTNTYVAAYTCSEPAPDTYKCGCVDATCASPEWQLQVFRR